jgi:hypothetical protein
MSPFVGCLLLLTEPAELVGGGGRGRLTFEEFSTVVEGDDSAGIGSVGKLSIEGEVGRDKSNHKIMTYIITHIQKSSHKNIK